MLNEISPYKGIFICLLSYFFISLIGVSEKCISHDINISTILLFQNLICLFLTTLSLLRQKIPLQIQQSHTYVIRIMTGLGCYALLFYIIRFMPISEALLYQYTGSLWIPFIGLIWLNVKMPKKLWTGILIGFVGITLILHPTVSQINFISLIGLLCGICQGISMVAIRKLSLTEPVMRIMFYNFLIATGILLPVVILHWHPIELKDAFFLLAVGLTTYIAQKLFTISIKFTDPSILAPICYTSILYSGIFGWLIWNEVPKPITLIGMGLVIIGCILTIMMNKPSEMEEEEESLEFERSV